MRNLFEEAQERISPELGKETNEICIGQVRFPVSHSQTPDLTKFIFGPQDIHIYTCVLIFKLIKYSNS